MSTLGYRLARLRLLALATTWILTCPVLADTGDKPVKLVVIVPADAIVTIDGTKTTSTGTRRTFESPPVAVGKKYAYLIKASWIGPDGDEVVHEKRFPVKPGETNELDLTQGETTKAAKLTLTAPPTLAIDAGTKKTIDLKIKRENCKGDIKITFSGVPKGGKISGITIVADKSEGQAELELPKTAKAGPADLTVKAAGGGARTEAKIKLSIKAAETAPPLAKLSVEGPGAVEIDAGGKKAITIKIKREHFKEPVKVTFGGAPAGIKIPDLTIAEDKTEGSVEVAAPKDAKAGTSTIKATAVSDKLKAEAEFKLTVKAVPASGLALGIPATVDVEAGGKKAFEIKVKDFKGSVKVTFEGLPAGVTIDLPTPGDEAGTVRVEVTAAKDAKVGPADVVAKADGASAKFKLNVKAAPKDAKDKEKGKDKDAKDKEKGK